ncbi:hypothetical protein DE146DRAFT_289970 [Phaeosphaeria sp. MPI-PUGE-AT-0046c]|nr:hypothetical protein DE146DRAFT_289970 [Phaeosphaeria sp. MPI-PUGE-AT-0046c]
MKQYSGLFLALAYVGFANAYFSMKCAGRIVRERLDPIVNPGRVAGHVHTISGGSGFSANMTFEDARASTCSSCPPKQDLSNYWTPQLYVKLKDGTGFRPVPLVGDSQDRNGGMTIYYLQRPGGDKLTAFPPGFRMLAGDSNKRSTSNDFASQAVSFHCLATDNTETNAIPNHKCSRGLRAQIFFPACWNGKDLDSLDHKSHVSYPTGAYNNGKCPASHPVHFISIFYEVMYDIARFDSEWVAPDQHPFVFANGDATGYGFHGDFVNGWDTNVLQSVIDTCVAHGDRDGDINDCHPISLYTDAEMSACKVPVTVDEKVDGKLAKLPGCNTPTYGPERATPPQNCGDNVGFGPGPSGNKVLTSKGWAYAGCGTDSVSNRAFKGASTASDNMTVESCVDFCAARNLPYAGLEYARECFCAASLAPGYVIGQGGARCDMECAGEEGTWCGGSNALSIYQKKAVGRKRGGLLSLV